MALWSGLGQAATAAQLVGVDLGGLISNIIQAAATARQNKKECEQLAGRVSMIDEILSQMQESDETMQKLLTGLENELREAHRLIVSCQERSAAYRFVMAKRQADKLREAQRRIDGYLLLLPAASHNITMRRFDEYYNALNPTAGCTTVPCNTYAGARSQRQYQPWDEEEEEQRATFYREEEDQGAMFYREEEKSKAIFYRKEEDQRAVFYREEDVEQETLFTGEEEEQEAVFCRDEEDAFYREEDEQEGQEAAFYREEKQERMFTREEEREYEEDEDEEAVFYRDNEDEDEDGDEDEEQVFYRDDKDEDEEAVFYKKEQEEGNTGAAHSWKLSMHITLPLIEVHGRICSTFVGVNQP